MPHALRNKNGNLHYGTKQYNADICKKAYAEIEDTYIIVSKDLYAFFS